MREGRAHGLGEDRGGILLRRGRRDDGDEEGVSVVDGEESKEVNGTKADCHKSPEGKKRCEFTRVQRTD